MCFRGLRSISICGYQVRHRRRPRPRVQLTLSRTERTRQSYQKLGRRGSPRRPILCLAIIQIGGSATNRQHGFLKAAPSGRIFRASEQQRIEPILHAIATTPRTTITAPATRATMAPAGPIFSIRTKPVSAATQIRLMTPTTKSKHINAPQQPTQ